MIKRSFLLPIALAMCLHLLSLAAVGQGIPPSSETQSRIITEPAQQSSSLATRPSLDAAAGETRIASRDSASPATLSNAKSFADAIPLALTAPGEQVLSAQQSVDDNANRQYKVDSSANQRLQTELSTLPQLKPPQSSDNPEAATNEFADAIADLTQDPDARPWWIQHVERPLLTEHPGEAARVELQRLVAGALHHSRRVSIARIDAFVERERIVQQDATFDWNVFTESLFNNTNQKTGSQLDAGDDIGRLIQQDLNHSAGLRRTNRLGANMEAKQNIRYLDSNSQFIQPGEQGFSQMALRYNQPLLRDGGLLVNEGQVIVARINANATAADSEAAIAEILVEVVQAYWEIYRLRSRYIVQKSLVDQIADLLGELSQRTRIDAKRSLIGQAEAELATQRATLASTRLELRRAQLRLVRAIGDRGLAGYNEFIPASHSPMMELNVPPQTAFAIAFDSRPEVRAAVQRIRQSELLNDISKRQILPQLALVLEASVNGVNGNYGVVRSFGDQFSEGGPTYAFGLNYELPVGNRAARSRARESQLLLMRSMQDMEDTIDQVRLDVADALAALEGSNEQFGIRTESIEKSRRVVDSLLKRRRIFPDEFDQVSQLYIREILDAQQRTAAAEIALIDLHADYATTVIKLRQATGTLLSQFGADGIAGPSGNAAPR